MLKRKNHPSTSSQKSAPKNQLEFASLLPTFPHSHENLKKNRLDTLLLGHFDQMQVLSTRELSQLEVDSSHFGPLIQLYNLAGPSTPMNGSTTSRKEPRDKETGEIVALKKLKLDEEKNGFPITSLREVMALMVCKHEHVVGVREIVVGDTLTQVFIVMDFIEHDLKQLLTQMPAPFLQSEVKTLLRQLISAVAHCHANWVLHRDLKTSNLLMNNRGQIKVADFGLARTFGDPLGDMTQLVVTLWYR
ncbi:hypothetical protein FRC10_004474 [Ceratobasidium sp. 414]|nr:hypothetical protein FRC10_004474 [Ceratobasidium sp. 414]